MDLGLNHQQHALDLNARAVFLSSLCPSWPFVGEAKMWALEAMRLAADSIELLWIAAPRGASETKLLSVGALKTLNDAGKLESNKKKKW